LIPPSQLKSHTSFSWVMCSEGNENAMKKTYGDFIHFASFSIDLEIE